MNLDGLKKLLGQVLAGPAQGAVKGVGQMQKMAPMLGTGGFGRLKNIMVNSGGCHSKSTLMAKR